MGLYHLKAGKLWEKLTRDIISGEKYQVHKVDPDDADGAEEKPNSEDDTESDLLSPWDSEAPEHPER